MQVIPPFTQQHPGIREDWSACDLDDLAPCGGVDVAVDGDVRWGELVERAVASGWPGIERLSGLTGAVAEVVRDNPEVDGQTPAQTVASVRAWDSTEARARSFAYVECEFGPGTSRFQETLPDGEDRYEIREVSFLFETGTQTRPIRDPELAALLGIAPGERVPLAEYAARRARRED
jgi:UDP-N-acetylmuramate dehydrogenase